MTDHDPNPSSDLPHPLPPDPSSDDTVRVLSGPPLPSADTHGDPAGRPRAVLPLPVIEGYEVIEEIGRGGMGVVYCAKQLAAGGRVVALKVMLGEAFARPEELRRFEREVEIASGLNHPNIARIYDSGLTHGSHYFAMEYIDGLPLDLYCKTRALRIDDRLQLFTTVCEAVACAHRRGIIHRDLKPSNILVDVEGNPHVLDFGLAKTHSDDESAERRSLLTIDGTVLGTLPYMAPEQAEGHTSAIDTRTDVYALGVILYELLTGKFPYEVTGQMAEVLKRIAEAEPKRPSTVNRLIGNEVETIILRALHKAPDRRYTGADDLARDVARFLAHEPIEAKRDSGWYVLRKTMRRHRVPVAVAAAIVLLIAIAAIVNFALYRKAEAQRVLAEASKKESLGRLARQHFNEGISWWFDRQDASSAAACFVEALLVSPDPLPAARLALHNALQECPQMRFPPHEEGRLAFEKGSPALSPDEKWLVTASSDGTARVWDAATGQPISDPMQHRKLVEWVAFSPDGKRVVTASWDKTARVWDAATGQPTSDPMQHRAEVKAAAFNPDGNRVVTTSLDKTARVWDAATGQPVSAPMRHDGYVRTASFSPDGKWVVTASEDKTARVWDAATGQPVSAPMRHSGSVQTAAFSPDGKQVVTASWERAARLWEAATGQPVSVPMQHVGLVMTAAFSPDGKRVVTASADGTARVWDAATGQPVSVSMRHGEHVVNAAAFSPDGKWVVTGSADGTARVWDAATGQPVSAPMRHDGVVWTAAFSPDGKRVVTSSSDKTVRVWDAAKGQPVAAPMLHRESVIAAAFSPDGKWVVTSSLETARVLDAATGQPVSAPMRHDGAVYRSAFSPDGKRVVTTSADETARVWDAATGQPTSPPMQHGAEVNAAAFSPNGKQVVTASADKTAQVWDAATGQPTSPPMQHGAEVNVAAFSPDGTRVVTASADKTARVWDAATGQSVSAPMQHRAKVTAAAFSSDGTRIVTAVPSSKETARVWDAATGQQVAALMRQGAWVDRVAFSPDGNRVVTASSDGTARVWDAATGQPVSAPMRHDSRVYTAAFSPDGRWVATASGDNTARVWDAATGQPVSAPMRHDAQVFHNRVFSAAFSPDGNRLVTAAEDKTARVWCIAAVDWYEPIDLIQARVRARLGVGVAPTGNVQPLSAEELAAAWRDYQRLQADYERARPKKLPPPAVPSILIDPSGFTYTTDDVAVTITKYTGQGGSIVIPDKINGVPVTRIGDIAFEGCAGLTGVRIPKGVTHIGDMAFLNCYNLATVIIPDGVIEIGEYAFMGCYRLASVTIPASVTSLGPHPFIGCVAIDIAVDPANPAFICGADGVVFNKKKTWIILCPRKKSGAYEIPEGVTHIAKSAFSGCSKLTRMTFPASITKLENRSLLFCEALEGIYFKGDAPKLGVKVLSNEDKVIVYHLSATKGWGKEFGGRPTKVWEEKAKEAVEGPFAYTVKEGAVTITRYTGAGGVVDIPDKINDLPVVGIGNNAFNNCKSVSEIRFPATLVTIGPWAFNGCVKLTSLTIPNGVTIIDDGAFNCCSGLTNVMLPNSLTKIGYQAFCQCPKLTNITIPSGVTSIEGNPFVSSGSLQSILVDEANPAFSSVDGVLFDKAKSGLVAYPDGKGVDYQMPSGVSKIWDSAFMHCSHLRNITIPNGVKSIGSSAFFGAGLNMSITIPASVESIGNNAFTDCPLREIIVDPANPNFSSSADGVLFDKMKTNLVSYPYGKTGDYVIPDGVTSIGATAFNRRSLLTNITIPGSVTIIGDSAFAQCSSLKSLYFKGDAPQLNRNKPNTGGHYGDIFWGLNTVVVYHLPATTGWGATFGGRPTAVWEQGAKAEN